MLPPLNAQSVQNSLKKDRRPAIYEVIIWRLKKNSKNRQNVLKHIHPLKFFVFALRRERSILMSTSNLIWLLGSWAGMIA